jgi:hypothetical protein
MKTKVLQALVVALFPLIAFSLGWLDWCFNVECWPWTIEGLRFVFAPPELRL